MPLYEYECKSCESVTEVLIRNQDDHTQRESSPCEHCGEGDLERVFSVPASPSVKDGAELPIAGDESCGAPRCCGGGCQF